MAAVAAGFVAAAAILAATAASAYRLETVTDNLANPWCVAFLPGGDFLVTGRAGTLRRVSTSGAVGEPIANVPPVFFAGQGGLFDVILDPDFPGNQRIYLSFAHGDMSANATRVVRARLQDNSLTDVEAIFTASPSKDTPQHYGGRMLFLPDGTLLLTTGDGFDYREQAQNTRALLGKTVRIRTDGSLPADNPFADGKGGHPAVWTYGHRNPQGLALDPATGTVYLHEHGPRGGDEVNVLAPGLNYGWPAITYGLDYSGAYVSPFTEYAGMEQPLHYWVPSIAPSGFAVYRGDAFPEWNGSLLVGALVDREIRRLSSGAGENLASGPLEEKSLFSEIGARIRDVRVGPDGLIYLLTDGSPGSLIRVRAD
ncbi:MAG: PQQ-dependent sugar dehydrogenase [Pseudomonadales bacterium]|nr:PQQ-dependent sugar dehydrogenase [Pseudomonadales bacterium]